MNDLPNEIKHNSVSSTMFMKLKIKVVAFFLGHPVCMDAALFIECLFLFLTVTITSNAYAIELFQAYCYFDCSAKLICDFVISLLENIMR